MRLFAIGVLALHAFLSYRTCTLANTTGKIPGNILPANNTLPLFLVGYSAELNNSELTCVHANYSGRLGNLVNWTLYFNYTDEDGENWGILGILFTVTIPEYPLFDPLEVNVTGFLKDYTDAQSKYTIVYFDNTSMILANMRATYSEKSVCSVWGTAEMTSHNLSDVAKMYVNSNCRNMSYVRYPDSCNCQ
uniref:Lipocalin n=1 Tax=Rhipicephalus appendiculatus TaxID=34631 RepID=A0A131YS67_RHIAP